MDFDLLACLLISKIWVEWNERHNQRVGRNFNFSLERYVKTYREEKLGTFKIEKLGGKSKIKMNVDRSNEVCM